MGKDTLKCDKCNDPSLECHDLYHVIVIRCKHFMPIIRCIALLCELLLNQDIEPGYLRKLSRKVATKPLLAAVCAPKVIRQL